MSSFINPYSFGGLSFVYNTVNVANTDNINIPAEANIGDFAVLFDCGSTPLVTPSSVFPSGWTSIRSDTYYSAGLVGTRLNLSYKILVSGDPGLNITGINASNDAKVLVVFTPNRPINSVTLSGHSGQVTASTPTAQSLDMTSSSAPVIGLAYFGDAEWDTVVVPSHSGITMNEFRNVTGLISKYVIYNTGESPGSATLSIGDYGTRNFLESVYFTFT